MNDSVKPIGKYRAIIAEPDRAPELYDRIVQLVAAGVPQFEELQRLLRAYHRAAATGVASFGNLVPTVGRSVLAQRLAGTLTYSGTVNYAALGDDPTTPVNGDTVLGNETFRQTITSATYANHIAYLSCFIAQGVATGTHYEGGLFIDGTGSVDTGQMFSHVLFSPAVAKGALNSLTLDISLTMA